MIISKADIKTGDIIRLDSDNVRDWVAIPTPTIPIYLSLQPPI